MTDTKLGVPTRRIEGRLKVTGAARYAADQAQPAMVFAYGVFSTIAAGTVTGLALDGAQRVPGVIDILYHGRSAALFRAPKMPISLATILTSTSPSESRLPFEDDRIYHAGQLVALVVADTFEHAREAAFKVQVSYRADVALPGLDEGVAAAPTRDGGHGHSRGDAAAGFMSAAHTVDQTYRTPVETHNPMEMHATVARWDDGVLHIFESSQGVVLHRNAMARVFGLAPDKVRVEAPFVGSGFGNKLFMWPHSVATALAARETGRPVKFVVPRANMFTITGHRPETRQHLRLGTDAAGKLVSISHESINTVSFLDDFAEHCGGMTGGLYSCPNVLVTHRLAQVNRGTPCSMRAPGAAPGLFALESAIDEIAETAGIDPLEFRLRNIAAHDESVNLPWSSSHLREALTRGADRFGWSGRSSRPGALRDRHETIGYGMAACNWDAYRLMAEAQVALLQNGTARVTCGAQDIGTGTYTVIAQTVAEIAGLAIAQVEVRLGDSSFPPAPISGGSSLTASVLPAVAEATRAAIAQLKLYATQPGAPFAGQKPEGIAFADGKLTGGGLSIEFATVLKTRHFASAEGQVRSQMMTLGKASFRSFGAHFVEVRWDPEISRLRVSRVVSAIDAGKIINPLAAANQIEGAIIMGCGMALFEATEYDARTARPTNNNFAEYLVPVHADQPEIDLILLDYPDFQLNEFGARGLGEIGVTGLPAAIANAVYNATGKRVRDLPITLDKLMDTAPPVQT